MYRRSPATSAAPATVSVPPEKRRRLAEFQREQQGLEPDERYHECLETEPPERDRDGAPRDRVDPGRQGGERGDRQDEHRRVEVAPVVVAVVVGDVERFSVRPPVDGPPYAPKSQNSNAGATPAARRCQSTTGYATSDRSTAPEQTTNHGRDRRSDQSRQRSTLSVPNCRCGRYLFSV
jgi:hypothetical protein